MTPDANGIMITIMAEEITIDRAGRLVIPKAFRDRLRLTAGTRILISEEEGRLILSLQRPEATLVERDGFLVLDIGSPGPVAADARDQRIDDLVRYALRKAE